MKPKLLLLLALLLQMAMCQAADESCMERCENGFDATKQCQCDSMCKYYRSCCSDYESVCHITARGDTFPIFPEDEENSTEVLPTHGPEHRKLMPLSFFSTSPPSSDADAEACSGRPFDSFMQLKNGSVYAFRGKYFFELGDKSVSLGYPKHIEDIWGIKGPIDAAFTRINCQGKTYIFKGNQYWRFDDGVLDEGYPRNISDGFENIPDHLDAAFAIPAHSHHGNEKVYFFKGELYYQYEFKNQPSHEECIQMSRGSPSEMFTRYTDIYYDHWVEHFNKLFGGFQRSHNSHHFINKDWTGIISPVNAVLAGRLYVSPRNTHWLGRRYEDYQQQWDNRWKQQGGQQSNQQQWAPRRRQNRSPSWESMAERSISIRQEFAQRFDQDSWQDQNRKRDGYRRGYDNNDDYRSNPFRDDFISRLHKNGPLQSIYFFKGDQYYRVNLQTKRVDSANPPYPRPIGKFWLGCPDKPGAEKR